MRLMAAHESSVPPDALSAAASEAWPGDPILDQPASPAVERRAQGYSGPDRRREATPMISRWSFRGGRRRAARRAHEREGSFVDVYGLGVVSILLFFFALTLFDSVATLVYLGKGGRELNPVAQWMMDQGAMFFVLVKGGLSGLCLLFVVLHKNFGAARLALGLGFGFYLLLGLYHLVLQIQAV